MTVRDLISASASRLKRARIPEARREAESLLAHALGRDEAWIVAHPDGRVASTKAEAYAAMIARRARHVPFAYVVGEKWFYGRKFLVNKHVLIPRPETELLVEAILGSRFRGNDGGGRGDDGGGRGDDGGRGENAGEAVTIIDVGTGSGVIGLTLAAELPKAKVILYDVSKMALRAADVNARALRLNRRVQIAGLDVLRQILPEPKRAKMFDRTNLPASTVIVANLPYLPAAAWRAAQPEVRKHEPKTALVSGKDGLNHYRALFKKLALWQRPPEIIALEAEPGQFAELRRLTIALMGEAEVRILKDLHGDERVLIASKRKRPVA